MPDAENTDNTENAEKSAAMVRALLTAFDGKSLTIGERRFTLRYASRYLMLFQSSNGRKYEVTPKPGAVVLDDEAARVYLMAYMSADLPETKTNRFDFALMSDGSIVRL